MPKLAAIIFDVDGTLADTEEYHRQAFNEAFREFGYDWEWTRSEYTKLLGISGGRERIRAFAESMLHKPGYSPDLRELAARLHQRKSEIYRAKLSAGDISLRPGVKRLLNEAWRMGLRMAIATSSSRQNVETLLGKALKRGMRYFQSVVTSDIVADKKPSPAVYQYALAELGLPPERCIAIEDTANGNKAALAAGLKTIITTHQFTRKHDFTGASLIVNRLGSPENPFTILRGDAHGASFVDARLMECILTGSGEIGTEEYWQTGMLVLAK
jgi:HAD superfamily hydrolase (TIGR01509 family)